MQTNTPHTYLVQASREAPVELPTSANVADAKAEYSQRVSAVIVFMLACGIKPQAKHVQEDDGIEATYIYAVDCDGVPCSQVLVLDLRGD